MIKKRPLLLLSNDDGYRAKGINSLVDMLRPMADIVVCAPEEARSGYACAFSATTPLRLQLQKEEEGLHVWSCNGTPVDCVKLALARIPGCKPDMVVGGINHGDNASVNTHYSGTMGIVVEGCMKYIPSVAFSLCDFSADADFEPLRPYVRRFTERVLHEGLPRGVCLNINFPKLQEFKGIRVCRMAFGSWYDETVECHHPRGYDYYWMVGSYRNDEPAEEDTDNWALQHGYIAITPTRVDVTDYETLVKIRDSWSVE